MNLLLIEDSESLRRTLRIGLSNLGYSVDESGDGAEALAMALSNDYDIAILDLMLPSVDGMSILKALRKSNKQTKVIILSARDLPSDKVDGLLNGADDYMTKPFSFDELHARLITISRRGVITEEANQLRVGDCLIDLYQKRVLSDGNEINVTPTEYRFMECLFINKQKVVSAEKLSEYVVGKYDAISKNAIEAHISSIRKKMKRCGAELPVKNKRGFGYVAQETS